MTHEEIYTALCDTKLPVAYNYWEAPDNVPALPYIVYYYPRSRNFGADNGVYQRVDALNVELFTSRKNFAKEALVEQALRNMGLFWNKTETYLSMERMYLVLYESEVIITDGE